MRKIPYVLIALLFPVVATGPVRATANSQSSSIVRGPYLSSVTRNSVVVSWTTKIPSRSCIQYGVSSQYGQSFTDQSLLTMHEPAIADLLPERMYHYRIVSDTDTTNDFTFWTAPSKPTPFSFVVYGDTRSNHVAHAGVLKEIEKNHPRFLVNTGDLVSRNTISNWDDYFADLCDSTNVGETVPAYATPGNHDSGTMFYDNLSLPHNNPRNTEEYYSFDYGSVHLVSVNSEIDYSQESEQYRWLAEDLASPAAKASKFIIAFWHRPPYSTSNHGSDMSVRKTLCPLVESHGVDIVFNGHDHDYERAKQSHATTYVVTGGGGGPLYDSRETADWTAYKEKAFHFCKVSVEGDILRMFMIRDDGSVRDSLIIDKSTPDTSRRKNKR